MLLGSVEVLKVYVVKENNQNAGSRTDLQAQSALDYEIIDSVELARGGICRRVGCADVFSKAFPIPFLICDSAGTCGFDGAVPN